jgi:hypothetical protein
MFLFTWRAIGSRPFDHLSLTIQVCPQLTSRTRAVHRERIYPHHDIMLVDRSGLLFGSLLLCLFLLHRIRRAKQASQAFGNLPAYFLPVSPVDFLSRVLPRIPWISGGRDYSWEDVYGRQFLPKSLVSCPAHSLCLGVFAASHSDIYFRSLFPRDTQQLLLADATAAKVGLVSERWPLCSSCPFRLPFRAMRHFLRLL